jgi:hypothetical protein
MSNLVQLSAHHALRVTHDDTYVLEATQRLSELVCELTDIAHHVIASETAEPLKQKIVQGLVGMHKHAHCISQDIIRHYRRESTVSLRQATIHTLTSPERAVVSRE